MKKRVLSLLMALALCFTMLPTAAFAEPAGGDVYTVDKDTAAQDQQKQDEQKQDQQKQDEAVQAAQALIDALPDEVTADGAEELQAQLIALDAALAALTEEQLAALDMTRYKAVCEALTQLTAEQANEHSHPICGLTHTDIGDHTDECAAVTWTAWNGVDEITYDSTNTAYVYLTGNVERDSTLTVAKGCTLYL